MVEARAVLNELSFGPAPVGHGDAKLVRLLAETLLALRLEVAVHDRPRVVFVTPAGIGGFRLPGGTIFAAALDTLDDDKKVLVKNLLLGPWIDESLAANWHFGGVPALGLAEAIASNGLAISLDRVPWRQAKLTAHPPNAASPTRVVSNAWQSTLDDDHRVALGRHLSVLPVYDNPGTHDPDSNNFEPGKSQLPKNARRVLEHAIPDVNQRWWARCEHNFIHRFDGSQQGSRRRVHWNGTTNPKAKQVTREEEVPSDVRQRLKQLEPARECGCRER